MAAHEIRIDQSRTLADEPGTGHNRWHPDIPPILTIEPGDEVLMEARDGGDALISRDSTLDELLRLDLNLGACAAERFWAPSDTIGSGNESSATTTYSSQFSYGARS